MPIDIEQALGPVIHDDGIWFDMPNEEYHADPALGSSGIKHLIMSPLTYWTNSDMNPDRAPEKETAATKFGDLMHRTLFNPAGAVVSVKPEGMSFATKEGKAWKADRLEDGTEIITADEARSLSTIKRAADAAGITEQVRDGATEVSYFFTVNGVRCKIRLDYMAPTMAFDLKTYANTMDKDVETAVAHAVAARRYHVSGVWYNEGIKHMRAAIENKTVKTFSRPNTFDMEIMSRISSADEYPLWFLFMDKGVPNVTVRQFTPKTSGEINSYYRAGRAEIERAVSSYVDHMEEFGANIWMRPVPWKRFDDVEFGAARWILDE